MATAGQTAKNRAKPQAVSTMKQQPIELQHRGQAIRGTVYRPTGDRRGPAMLMLHRFTGQRSETGFLFVTLARALVEQGIAVATFDFRHSGESDGAFEHMLPTGELEDAQRVTNWLLSQPYVDRTRVGLLGFSLGGLIAACLTARVDVFRALVLLAPTTSENLCRHAESLASDEEGGRDPGEPYIMGPHKLHPDIFADVSALDAVGDVVKNPRPTLLVQGTGDKAVPPNVSDAFVEAMRQAGIACDHELIGGADHGFNQVAWRERLIERVVTWSAEQLNG